MRLAWLSEHRAPLCSQLLLAFAALVCVEGFAPAAAPSMLSRSKVAARPQVRRRTMPCTLVSDACGSAPLRTAAPAETSQRRGCTRPCPVGLPWQTSTNFQPWQAVPTMGIGGINGALDFGPLASGVGGEGTGLVRRCRARRALHAHRTQRCKPSALACTMVCSEPAMLLTAYPYHFQALGANEPSLLAVLLLIPLTIGFLFAGWQGYQDDDEDFFDTYDSRREDREITNRNRV